MTTSNSSCRARIKGIALSVFVAIDKCQPAVKEARSSHKLALGAFLMLIMLQVLPRPDFLPVVTRLGLLMETALLCAMNLLFLGLCAFWFWLYFADRESELVRVRPQFLAQPISIRLALPDVHSSQLILLVLPLMLAAFVALAAALAAQAAFLVLLLSDLHPSRLLLDSQGLDCTGFGTVDQRALLAVFSTVLGSDHACMKLSSATSLGALLIGCLWAARSVLAAVAFGVFVQFGTVIVRRHRSSSD